MQIKTTVRYHLKQVTVIVTKESINSKYFSEYGEKGTLLHCWWECKLVQQPWGTIWRVLKKLKAELSCDLAIPLWACIWNKLWFEKIHAPRCSCCCSASKSLWPYGLPHARFPCPSPSPGACSDSCLLSPWSYLTISSSAAVFSFCLQSFPASESFPKSQFFASGDQNIGASTSASVLPMNIQGWFSFQTNWFDFLDV